MRAEGDTPDPRDSDQSQDRNVIEWLLASYSFSTGDGGASLGRLPPKVAWGE
jgi:hypothetical protein